MVKKPTPKLEETNGEIENGDVCTQNGVLKDVIRCSECGTKYPEENVENFIKSMEFSELHLSNMKDSSVACILFYLIFLCWFRAVAYIQFTE